MDNDIESDNGWNQPYRDPEVKKANDRIEQQRAEWEADPQPPPSYSYERYRSNFDSEHGGSFWSHETLLRCVQKKSGPSEIFG